MLAFVTLTVSVFPTFSAKFVPLKEFYHRPSIADARSNLSASGGTYIDMVDSHPKIPLLVVKGREVKLPMWKESQVFSGAFLGSNQVSGDVIADEKIKFFTLKIEGEHARISGPIDKVPLPSSHVKASWQEGDDEAARIARAYAASRSLNIHTSRFGWQDFPRSAAWQLRQVSYFPVVPGYEDAMMHDSEQYLPVIRVGNRSRALADCVVGGSTYDFRDVAWVPQKGEWFVTMGYRGKQFGLFWLFPKPARTK